MPEEPAIKLGNVVNIGKILIIGNSLTKCINSSYSYARARETERPRRGAERDARAPISALAEGPCPVEARKFPEVLNLPNLSVVPSENATR